MVIPLFSQLTEDYLVPSVGTEGVLQGEIWSLPAKNLQYGKEKTHSDNQEEKGNVMSGMRE